jgi:hypothetical protein
MNLFNTALVTLALKIPVSLIKYKLEIIYSMLGLFLFCLINTLLWLRSNADREDARQKAIADERADIHRYM